METVRFLRDIDDEKAYAQTLECCYVDAMDAIADIERKMFCVSLKSPPQDMDDPMGKVQRQLIRVINVMRLVRSDCADRRKRLANVAAGLPDVVFDEETPES